MYFVRRNHIIWLGVVLAVIVLPLSYWNLSWRSTSRVNEVVAAKTIFSFLGAPGCGKGTLAEQCVKNLGFQVVSTGNLCREEIAKGSDKGKMISEYTRTARLVPDKVIAEMLDGWLSKQVGDRPIILDGYPRTQNQAKILAELLKTKFSNYRFRVVSLDVHDLEEIVHRIAGRLVCENKKCQATTHKSLLNDSDKLICEICGSTLVRRDDDKEEIVRKRLLDFTKNNNEIIAFYKDAGVAVESLNVSHSTPKHTLEEFEEMIKKS